MRLMASHNITKPQSSDGKRMDGPVDRYLPARKDELTQPECHGSSNLT